MSVPPLIASAPGAASGSLLTKITESSAGTSLYAPASGGGGGGGGSNYPANPSFSSISLAAVAPIVQNGSPGQVVFQNATTPTVNDVSIFTNTTGNSFVQQFQPGGAANSISIRSPANAYALNFGTTDNAGCVIAASVNSTGDQSTLTVIADKVVIPTNLSISTINGVAYPPPAEVIPPNLTVSTLVANTTGFIDAPAVSGSLRLQKRDGVGGSLVYLSNGVNTSELDFTPTGLGVVGNLGVSGSNFTLSPGFSISGNATTNLTTMAISGGGQMIINNVSSIASVYGSFNSTNTFAAAIGNANISSIYNVANNLAGQNAPSLIPIGIPGVSDNTYQTNMVQAGYVQDLPYLSTILFPRPYPNDNSLPLVILTPTNRNVSSGGNPQMSLNAGFGNYNTGVSSIGFQVDARNGGVGYVGSFNWLAIPQTT